MDRIPHIWCPGCGIGTTVNCFARALEDSKADLDKVAVVSGIGCTGRVAGYVKLDSFHTTHGRAIPFATGLKLANPELTGGGLLGRRRPVCHRRQPLHPRRAAQHGPQGDLRQQLHLCDDGRADRADHARGQAISATSPYGVLRAGLQPGATGGSRRARLTWRAGRLTTSGSSPVHGGESCRRRDSASSRCCRPARRCISAGTRWATASTP